MRWLTILVLLTVPMTGCLGGDDGVPQARGDDAGDGDGGGMDPLAPVAIPYDTEGCVEAIGLFLLDPSQAASHLPDGFAAADAQGLLGLPIASGQAAAFVNVYDCDTASIEQGPLRSGELALYVETPDLGDAFETSGSAFDFYQFSAFTSGPATLDAFARIGADAVSTELTLATGTEPLGSPATGQASVEDAQGPLYSFAYAAPGEDMLEGIVRLWHLTDNGTAVVDLDIPEHPVRQGTLTECSIREGSVVHEVLGTTDCTGQQNPVVVFPEQSWEGAIRHFPGVWPAS